MGTEHQPSRRRAVTLGWSVVMVVLGTAIVVRTLVAGGGALALGLLVGVLFVLAGAGRFWTTWKGLL